MSTVALPLRDCARGNVYLPEVRTSVGDIARTSIASRIRDLLPSRKPQPQVIPTMPVGVNELDAGESLKALELWKAQTALVTAFIESSSIGLESDSTRSRQISEFIGGVAVSVVDVASPPDVLTADEPNVFQWSKRRHQIRKLVREFSEQTHADY